MIRRPERACRRHRATLLDFVDRPRRGPLTVAALDHLERCAGCREELADLSQVVSALRRLGRELEDVEPPGGAWFELRQRIARPADAWRWRSTLGGMMVSALLVAVIIVPTGRILDPVADPAPTQASEEGAGARRIEDAYLASRRADARGPIDGSPVAGRSLPLLRTEAVAFRKEVKPAGPRPRLI